MQKALFGLAAVVAVAVAGAVALRLHHDDAQHISVPRNVPASVDGVPYGGVMPWSDAVSDPTDPRRIFVWVPEQTIRGVRSCGTNLQRAVATATASTMTVFVAGYARPTPSDVACAGAAIAPQPLAVMLPAPLRGRSLVDAFAGTAHRLLDARSVPALDVPGGYRAAQLSWDERSGIATRIYMERRTSRSVVLRFGPPKSALFPSPTDLSVVARVRTTVEGRPAQLDTVRTPAGVEYLVTWTRADGTMVIVNAPGLSSTRMLALVRSVH